MASFQNYIDLRFAVSDHVGNRAISDVFPRLVQMAEDDFNQRFRTRYQITDATLTFVDGVAPLPADFLEILHVYGTNGYQMRAGQQAGFRRVGSGFSQYQIGASDITIYGFSGDRDIQYYAAIPTLTSSATATNWLLERYPSVYLYGVGLQAAKHLRDVDLATATDQLYTYAIGSMKVDDERARWSGSIVRVQGQNP